MVDHLENLPDARLPRRVVEGGAEIEQDEGGSVDRAADHLPNTFPKRGKYNQQYQHGDADENADAVCDGMGQLLAGSIGSFAIRFHFYQSGAFCRLLEFPDCCFICIILLISLDRIAEEYGKVSVCRHLRCSRINRRFFFDGNDIAVESCRMFFGIGCENNSGCRIRTRT